MENINNTTSKSNSAIGWVFGGLSFIPLIGVLFGIIAITIGAVKKIKGQVFLGLAGILVTVGIYGALYYFGSVAKTGVFAELKIKLASRIINDDAGQILLYKNKHKKLPSKLSDLGTPSQANLVFTTDPWGTELVYILNRDRTFELRSAGPDKIMNTKDDIAQTY